MSEISPIVQKMTAMQLLEAAERLSASGSPADAAHHYQTWLAAHPGDPLAYALRFNLALQLLAGGDAAGAEQAYRAAVAARPDFASAWLNLGLLLQSTGRMEEALNCWSVMLGSIDVVAERASYLRGLNQLGQLLAALQRRPQALQMLLRSLQIEPDQPDVAQLAAGLQAAFAAGQGA